jgi:hypothetical protein
MSSTQPTTGEAVETAHPEIARSYRPTFGACLGCRRVKTKCIVRPPSDNAPAGSKSCERCSRLAVPCMFTPHRKGTKPKARTSISTGSKDQDRIAMHNPSRLRLLAERPAIETSPDLTPEAIWPPLRSSPYVVIYSMLDSQGDTSMDAKSIFAVPRIDQVPDLDPLRQGIIHRKDAARLFKRCGLSAPSSRRETNCLQVQHLGLVLGLQPGHCSAGCRRGPLVINSAVHHYMRGRIVVLPIVSAPHRVPEALQCPARE